MRGLHPFVVPGTDIVPRVTVHNPPALQQGPALHGAGVRKRERPLHWSKNLGCCKMAYMKGKAEGETAASRVPGNILYMLGSTRWCNDFSHQPLLGSLRREAVFHATVTTSPETRSSNRADVLVLHNSPDIAAWRRQPQDRTAGCQKTAIAAGQMHAV